MRSLCSRVFHIEECFPALTRQEEELSSADGLVKEVVQSVIPKP